MFKQLITILGIGALTASFATFVTTTNSANDLVAGLIGGGITVSNASFIGSATSAGIYTGSTVESQGNSNLSQGIVLSSGNAAYLNHTVNSSNGITGYAAAGSDSDLESLLPSNYNIKDYSALTFDFEAGGEAGTSVTCSFWYVFGSDEYDEYVGSNYNDVFGFFLDGTNVATIPGTTTPVSINNVNGGTNSAFFTSNDYTKGATLATEMDGLTKPLFTEFTVNAGEKHTMKLAIGDAGDAVLDSWVLLGGKTFTNKPADVPEPGTTSLLIIGLATLMGYGFRKRRNYSKY